MSPVRVPVCVLDLRHLAPPEPMERILEAVQSLKAGECLDAMTPLYPAPVLAILRADGFTTDACPMVSGYRVRIARGEFDGHLDGDTPAQA